MVVEVKSRNLLLHGVTFALILSLYLITLPPHLTWAHWGGDGGDLITASMTWGIPHPHGYPTYVVIGRFFATLIPFGSIAYRFNLFSAVCTTSAILLFTSQLPQKPVVRTLTALTLATTPLIWSQAIIAEVYGLNLLILAALWWSLTRPAHPFWQSFFFGLALTTHLTSWLWFPLLLFSWRDVRPKLLNVGSIGAGLFIGSLPFALLPLFAQGNSPVLWGEATTWRGFWWLVSGEIYRPNTFHLIHLQRLLHLTPTIGQQWAYWGWVLLPLYGLGCSLRESSRRGRSLITLVTALIYAFYALTYDTPDAAVSVLPTFFLLAPFLAQGLEKIGNVGICLPLLSLVLNFSAINQHQATALPLALNRMMEQLPPKALVLTQGDATIFTLWYAQHVEKQRPDLLLVDSNLFAFSWYRLHLGRLYGDLSGLDRDDLAAFRAKNQPYRPICTTTLSQPVTISCYYH